MASYSVAVRELPLFPLPEVVLFPGRPLPLHIFEFRYRIMMNTILESDNRFGVLMWDSTQDKVVATGCCARIEDYQRLPDDRMKILTIGEKRFRVLDTVREKPYFGLPEKAIKHMTKCKFCGKSFVSINHHLGINNNCKEQRDKEQRG